MPLFIGSSKLNEVFKHDSTIIYGKAQKLFPWLFVSRLTKIFIPIQYPVNLNMCANCQKALKFLRMAEFQQYNAEYVKICEINETLLA